MSLANVSKTSVGQFIFLLCPATKFCRAKMAADDRIATVNSLQR